MLREGLTLTMNFDPVHDRENNPTSQAHLDEHRERFNEGCWRVLMALVRGERITTIGACLSGLSGHLPRRIKDLKDVGIEISEDRKDKGVKEWYMTEAQRATLAVRLMEAQKIATKTTII